MDANDRYQYIWEDQTRVMLDMLETGVDFFEDDAPALVQTVERVPSGFAMFGKPAARQMPLVVPYWRRWDLEFRIDSIEFERGTPEFFYCVGWRNCKKRFRLLERLYADVVPAEARSIFDVPVAVRVWMTDEQVEQMYRFLGGET